MYMYRILSLCNCFNLYPIFEENFLKKRSIFVYLIMLLNYAPIFHCKNVSAEENNIQKSIR